LDKQDKKIALTLVLLTLILMVSVGVLIVGCTEQMRARTFGGNANEEVPCGHKIFDVTWKGDDLWIATQPMGPEDVPRTITFVESSSFGMGEGTVTFKESRCSK